MTVKIQKLRTGKQMREAMGAAMFTLVEATIFSKMRNMSKEYTGGSWQFASVNGVPFMYPKMEEKEVTLINSMNYFEGAVCPEAAGFAICTLAYNHIAHDHQHEKLADLWEKMMDNVGEMKNASEIYGFLD